MDSLLALRWTLSVLNNDATLTAGVPGGFYELPVENAKTPWGRIESIGQAQDERADEGGQLIWAKPTLLITVFDAFRNYSRIEPMADQLYILLNGQHSIDVPGTSPGVMYSCIRDFDGVGVENVGGKEVRRIYQQFSFLTVGLRQPVIP